MVKKIKLQVQQRSEKGKGAARTLRRQGFTPAVIYGHGEETRPCKVDTKELDRLLSTVPYESTVIDLKLDDGNTPSVLIREVQLHPYRREILHVDFLAVRKGEKVKLDVPVRLVGLAVGVKEGGILEHLRHEVEIRCVPSMIPEALEFDISELAIGDSVTVDDLRVPEGVEILDDAATTLAAIVPPSVHKVEEVVEEVEAEVAEEEAEPELVGRGKREEEEAREEEQ